MVGRHITAVVADDEAFVRNALRTYLSADGDIEVVAEAIDGRDALDQVAAHDPDVLLLDLQMPDLDGIEVTRQLRARQCRTRVLVVTAHLSDRYVAPALLAGASGYLVKDCVPRRILQAVRDVAEEELSIDPQVTRYLIETAGRMTPPPHHSVELTDRERQVLEKLCTGLSNKEMADELMLAESTIKYYLSGLMQKFDSRDRVQLVISAFRSGVVR
ncbi:Transcriptional regulatory protein DegU [Austwickia sp. TVS 96-490-7B]|uniref:response regulator transcription factor n=1 Tax=Austwickia sp. TVS 96-490-7B TaxID=2830843 RepID=UPI001C559FD4|nr:response regulator transcription factor [Austwickia sp. TVS 96-490-7B]MBW3086133.1 Transcriptional regulatory protein DegU [Austwickia sp. TVS 96-490-7B]